MNANMLPRFTRRGGKCSIRAHLQPEEAEMNGSFQRVPKRVSRQQRPARLAGPEIGVSSSRFSPSTCDPDTRPNPRPVLHVAMRTAERTRHSRHGERIEPDTAHPGTPLEDGWRTGASGPGAMPVKNKKSLDFSRLFAGSPKGNRTPVYAVREGNSGPKWTLANFKSRLK